MLFKKKEVTIYIHGFGLQRQDEVTDLQACLKQAKINVISFDLYDEHKDEDWYHWVATAEQKIKDYLKKGYRVNVIGFSMGGVIASFLASYLKVHKLVLLAPAFEFFDFEAGSRFVNHFLHLNQEEKDEYLKKRMLDYQYFISFQELVKRLKVSIKKVSCPLLILQGTEDEYVPNKASLYAYESCQSKEKYCYFLPKAMHELHRYEDSAKANVLIKLFLKDKFQNKKV